MTGAAGKKSLFASNWFRLSIMVVGVGLSMGLWLFVDQLEHKRAEGSFKNHADDTFEALINRINGYSRTLDGAAALFASQEEITAVEWKYYVDTLNIEENLPDILGVGYAVLIRESDGLDISGQFLERGIDLPPVHPDTGLPERFIVQFLEPAGPNSVALGLDIGFEPERRRSAQIARETNTIQLTPPINLISNSDSEPSFLLLRPHYRARADLSTAEAMADAFEGWVYMPFVGGALFTSLTSQQTNVSSISVSDGAPDGTQTEVFSNRDSVASENPLFVETRDVSFFGRNWTLTWHSTPSFERTNEGYAKWIVLFLGLIIFGLIVLICRVFAERERQVEIDVELKTAELRAKSEETLSVIENAVVAVFVVDEDERILSANPAATHLFETINIKPGMPVRDVVVIKHDDDESDQYARCAWCPAMPNLRLRVQRNEWSAANGLRRSTLLVQDVSKSEAHARQLAANEARWNLAMEGAKIGVFDMDLENKRSVVSATWRELMGVPDADADIDAHAQFYSRVHPDDLPALLAAEKACIEGKTDRSVSEYRMQFDDGSVRWMRSDAVVVARDKDGKALRLIGAQIDETDLRETREALKASRERFEIVLEQAPVGMAVFSIHGRFIGMNGALCRMTGYSEDEMRNGMLFRDLLSPSDHKAVMRSIQNLKAQNLTSYQGEYQFIPKNGPTVWGLLNVAWTFDTTMQKEAFIVQIVDISEKKNIEKMKMEFVATVSHELRTPLTSIKGALGLMSGPMLEKMPAGAERLLEIAAGNTDRLSSLVNDILDLEKISSGEVDFHLSPTDLNESLTQSMEQMLPFAVQHKVDFELELPPTDVIAMVDPQRTQQLIINLLSNACKYSDNETVVHLRLETIGDVALICILNTGPVISDEFKAKIFRPFSQADASDTRTKGGTGLGLNISRQIVERMGGDIGFKSERGEPTAFWFTVPLAFDGLDAEVPTLQLEKPQSRFDVLHLEDDADFSEIIRKGLNDFANVRPVSTVAKAREVIRSEKFDLIVIDWHLPDGHGQDLLDEIETFQSEARIISLSASETRVRDMRVDYEIVKSRTSLEDIVSKMVKYSQSA